MKILKFFILTTIFLLNDVMKAMDLPAMAYTDEQYLHVARYIALRRSKVDQETRQKMDNFLMNDHSISKNVNRHLQIINRDRENAIATVRDVFFLSSSATIIFTEFYKDIFIAMCQVYLPESYEDHGGFFNPENNRGVYEEKPDINAFLGLPALKKEKKPIVSQEAMIQELRKMSFTKALSVFRYITQTGITLNFRMNDMITDSSIVKHKFVHSNEKHYWFPYEVVENMAPACEHLLRNTVLCSNAGHYNIDNRFAIRDAGIALLKPHKDFILKNALFSEAEIKVDIPASTMGEKIKDKLLFGMVPIFVITMPDMIYHQTTGIMQCAGSIITCIAGSGFFGGHAHRILDSYNSNVGKLALWFGKGNHKSRNEGGQFIMLSMLNCACVVMAQKFLSWYSMPWKVVGGMIYAARACVMLYALRNMENVQNKNPFRRANGEGLPFTLKDLMNGPKCS